MNANDTDSNTVAARGIADIGSKFKPPPRPTARPTTKAPTPAAATPTAAPATPEPLPAEPHKTNQQAEPTKAQKPTRKPARKPARTAGGENDHFRSGKIDLYVSEDVSTAFEARVAERGIVKAAVVADALATVPAADILDELQYEKQPSHGFPTGRGYRKSAGRARITFRVNDEQRAWFLERIADRPEGIAPTRYIGAAVARYLVK